MKKLMLSVLALALVPTACFAFSFHVDMPPITSAPDFNCGPETINTTIGGVTNVNEQIYKQVKGYEAQQQILMAELQRQADENAKELAEAAGKGELGKVEKELRKYAQAQGHSVDVKSDATQWELTYTIVYSAKEKRIDTATVDYPTSTCTIVTKFIPYGIATFGVAQFKKQK